MKPWIKGFFVVAALAIWCLAPWPVEAAQQRRHAQRGTAESTAPQVQADLSSAEHSIGDWTFPVVNASAPRTADRTDGFSCCTVGETRSQSKVASIDLMTPKGLNKNKYVPADGPREMIYSPPQSCWVISSYQRVVTSANGPLEATDDAQPANFNYLTTWEYESVQEEMQEYVGNLNILDEYKADLYAKIEKFIKSYGQYAHSISTSHGQVRHRARVGGQGAFNGRSWYSGHITSTETCSPAEVRDAAALRETIKTWVDETVSDLPQPSGHWTTWLNRDDPGGKGDFETLREFLAAGQACTAPTGIECQTLDGRPWNETGEVVTCRPDVGGYCYNEHQRAGKRCSNYRVRFLCP